MANWFFIFWLLSSNLFCNVSGKWNKFKTQAGIIYQTFYLTTTVQTFIHCTLTCHLEEPCGAVNYNTISSECQLIDKQDVGMPADGNFDGIWIVTKKGIYCNPCVSKELAGLVHFHLRDIGSILLKVFFFFFFFFFSLFIKSRLNGLQTILFAYARQRKRRSVVAKL